MQTTHSSDQEIARVSLQFDLTVGSPEYQVFERCMTEAKDGLATTTRAQGQAQGKSEDEINAEVIQAQARVTRSALVESWAYQALRAQAERFQEQDAKKSEEAPPESNENESDVVPLKRTPEGAIVPDEGNTEAD